MSAPTCARCGSNEFQVHITAFGVDHYPEVHDAVVVIDPVAIEDPQTIQVEALCVDCKHVRYLTQHEWEWA
jgi:hypothetical protein